MNFNLVKCIVLRVFFSFFLLCLNMDPLRACFAFLSIWLTKNTQSNEHSSMTSHFRYRCIFLSLSLYFFHSRLVHCSAMLEFVSLFFSTPLFLVRNFDSITMLVRKKNALILLLFIDSNGPVTTSRALNNDWDSIISHRHTLFRNDEASLFISLFIRLFYFRCFSVCRWFVSLSLCTYNFFSLHSFDVRGATPFAIFHARIFDKRRIRRFEICDLGALETHQYL